MKPAGNPQRLQRDFDELTKTAEGFVIQRDDNQLDKWTVTLQAHKGSVYEGRQFTISVDCEGFPFAFPKVTVTSQEFHPNIDPLTGKFCHEMMGENDWKPARKISSVFATFIGIINEPQPDVNPLNMEAAQLFKSDLAAFKKKALNYKGK